jgi:hypothetical protein
MEMKTKLALASILTLTLWAPLAAQPPGSAEENQARLDASASWGIELESGQIAIDPTLVVYADSHSRTVIINPKYTQQAAEHLGATLLPDGSFGLEDGTTVKPLVAAGVIRAGNEPEGVLEDSGLPVVEIDRVRLMAVTSDEATAAEDQALREAGFKGLIGELRLRIFRRCTGCTLCPTGCQNGQAFLNRGYQTCEWSSRISVCPQIIIPQCFYFRYFCRDCSGPLVGASATVGWACGYC